MIRILAALILFLIAFPAWAQETADEERSYLIGYVEGKLSTPNRQIRLNNIQGALSSDATIGEITIADREGVWLRIINARIIWTRSQLLFGNLDIDRLAAERIEILRKPLPDEGAPAPEAGGFAIPELPVSVQLDELAVPLVTFGEGVFGLASQISVQGRLTLSGGSLDTGLQVTRLDGPGGQFNFTANYANTTQVLALDMSLDEPANGVVANLLGVDGRPPMRLALQGNGPIAALDVNLTLDAASQRVLAGTANLRQNPEGIGFTADVGGPIAALVPAQFRPFFGANTRLQTQGVVLAGGGVSLESLTLNSGALSVQAALRTAADGFLRQLKLNAVVDDPQLEKTVLPVAGGQTTVARAAIDLSFGEGTADAWTGGIKIDEFATASFASKLVDIKLGGLAQNLDDAAARSISFQIDGGATGIIATDAAVAEALGDAITLDVDGSWRSGKPIDLPRARIAANGFSLGLVGSIAESVFNGTIDIDAPNVSPLSSFTGRQLTGGLKLAATGSLAPLSGGFNLDIDGTGSALGIGVAAADKLLSGETRLTGGIARGEDGLVARQLRVANEQAALTADGSYATGMANFKIDASLEDISKLSDRLTGKLRASGTANGADGRINLSFNTDIIDGSVLGKTLTDAKVGFNGLLQDGRLNGEMAGGAFLDGERAEITTGIAIADGARTLTGLKVTAGGARIIGDLTQASDGLVAGKVTLDAAEISTLAAIVASEAKGAIEAGIELLPVDGKQNADVKATVRGLTIESTTVGTADVTAAIADLFGVPQADAKVNASNVVAGGIEIAKLGATAKREGNATAFSATSSLKNGANIAVTGDLAPLDGGYRLSLSQADLKQGNLAAGLASPASLHVRGQNIQIDDLTLDVAGGRVSARGEIADTLNVSVDIKTLPLAIANAIRPDLQLGGTIDGSAMVTGTRVKPDASFNLTATRIAAAALRQAGLSTLNVNATGQSNATRLNVKATVSSPEGLRAGLDGSVPLDGGALDLAVDLDAFPIAVLNTVAPGQRLGGSVAGSARITGALDNPAAQFQVRANGVRATPLDGAGLSPLGVEADGSFRDRVVTLNRLTVNGPQGFSVSGRGRIPLTGAGLDVSATGEAPLSLANRFLADRGTQVSGTLSLSASASGSIAAPVIRGMFSTIGAQVVDPETNLRVNNLAVMAALDGNQVTLRNVSGALSTGGTVSATGTVSTSAAAGFPADIRILLSSARYVDGTMVAATVSGNLALTGPLTRDPLLSGQVNIERAEITVPESFAAGASQIDVIHKDAPADVRATLKRAKANDGTPVPGGRPSVVRLDVTVNAPNQIFVRGRGLDSEIGGSVRLTGPVTAIEPVGAFRLLRGRLSILGQRITFDEGTVTLVGDLDPFLNFVARTGSSDITVFVTVSGRVSDLDISFSSQPELPEDEVLARLIFNRSLQELSPIQIAQLAAAAAELAGGSNTSLLGSLRKATGLDDLDVVTDSEGNAAVRAGRYIRDNIYLGVEAGAQGTTRGTINLDITENLKARGALGSDGDSGLGVFYEKDY